MKTNEFIFQELQGLSIKDVKNLLPENEQSEVIEYITQIFNSNGVSDIENLLVLIKEDEKLGRLKNLTFIIEQLMKVNDFDFSIANFQNIEQRVKNDPKNRIYSLLWVMFKINLFETDEYLDIEYSEFLKAVFEKFDYLVNLDDFLNETRVLLIKPFWESWESEIFQPVFETASKKYPQKHALKRILSQIYFKNEDYKPALDCLEEIMGSIKSDLKTRKNKSIGDIEFPYFEYLETVQLYGIINYILGDHEKAIQLLTFVINNLPKVEFENGEEDEVLSYIDSFIFRMKYNIQYNRFEYVLQDYQKIKEYLSWGDWQEEYPEVFKYINDKKVA